MDYLRISTPDPDRIRHGAGLRSTNAVHAMTSAYLNLKTCQP